MLHRIRIRFPVTLLLICLIACVTHLHAQETGAADTGQQAGQSGEDPLEDAGKEHTGRLKQLREELAGLDKSYLQASGEDKAIFWNQIRSKRKELGSGLEELIAYIGKLEDAGRDAAQYQKFTRELLSVLSADLTESIKESQKKIIKLREQRSTASAEEQEILDKQIEELGFYRRSEAFDEKEKITIRFADIVTRGATAVDLEVLEYVGKYYSEDEIVELTMVIALANLVNRINDTLQIEPDLGLKI